MRKQTGVHVGVSADGIALVDTRPLRGRWFFLDPVGAQLWAKATTGTRTPEAVEEVVGYWQLRGVDPARVRADLTQVADSLERARLLVPAQRPTGRPARRQVRFAVPVPGCLRDQVAGQVGLALALVLLRCTPLRITLAVARAATRLPGRAATVAEAETAHAAVRRGIRAWPGRAACLEESLATFLAAALTGRRLRWVLGARLIPHGAHAWVEAEEAVIGQAETDRVWPYIDALQVERSN
ncbi:lasso peptide biosynthesis B2 protein [Streptomyces sp. NPDC059564]|uniref:lasso peptide biosynthesis B2 protein n=1 Tax=Streptomyces sp. NPDC059564 TaxID=3346865 RepID=UPI00369E3F65